MRFTLFVFISTWLIWGCSKQVEKDKAFDNWSVYLGDAASSQYSPLKEITPANVSNLKVAWTYDSNEAHPEGRSQIQCNPLSIDGILYGSNARLKVFALEAATGKQKWIFDPFDNEFNQFGMGVNRGLVYHQDQYGKTILFTAGSKLYSLNAENGSLRTGFGDNGTVDLHKGLGRNVDSLFINSNSPGIIFENLLIMGCRVSESTGAAPGHIRAYDVNTGKQQWIFHTIPHPGEEGHDTWPEGSHLQAGGANVWAGFSLDQDRGIVYCPTGSASFDFYGGDRHGANLFANCIVALDARTGVKKWHYQTIHHDLWDKDLPAPPNLITIEKDGKKMDALAQISKNGLLFVLNRENGKPIYPINEIEVPQTDLEGEKTWKTQPIPTFYPRFSRTTIAPLDLAIRNPLAHKYAKGIMAESKPFHMFQPPSQEGTIIFPGFDGGGEWGGAAYDPEHNSLITNSSEMPWRAKLEKVRPMTQGERTYNAHCRSCHGTDFKGNEIFGSIPSLENLKQRLSLTDATATIQKGKGIMPHFSYIDDTTAEAVYNFINGDEDKSKKSIDKDWPYPYVFSGYEKLYAPDGYPMIKPPWGQLTSIDMNSGKINWQVPLGEHEELKVLGMKKTGTEVYGGSVVTAGGLIFIAATMDEKIRAFDKVSGTELWSYGLPAAGYATPSIYAIDGKQYIVIACGGGKLGTKSGDQYLAFSL